MWPLIFDSATLFAAGFILFTLVLIERHVMSTQSAVDALTAQVTKIQAEVLTARDTLAAQLADVQAQLDAANVPAEVVDLSGLAAAVQSLDDINPDPAPADPVEPPTE